MRKIRGYSLLELLSVIFITSILIILVIPAWRHFTLANSVITEINRLVGIINFARSEAIKRGVLVTLCPSIDRQHCAKDWSEGLLLFVDKKGDGVVQSPQAILRIYAKIPASIRLRWEAFSRGEYLQLAPTGFTHEQNGTFVYCPRSKDAHYARAIIISKAGRIRLSTDENQDGIDEDADGRPLRCRVA